MSETSNERILVVDDEENVRRVLRQMLESAGYEVIVAANGNQALDLVAEQNPALVLLDLRMPGKSGMEVLKEMKADYPDVAVIVVTAVDEVNIAIEAIRNGAYDYLHKPFDANALIISVVRALEKRRLILKNRDYEHNLERKVAEQTQLLEQKIKELTALNNLFVTYLNQGFEAADKYGRLSHDIIEMTKEAQRLSGQGADIAETCANLAAGIIKAAEGIRALAKEAEARRVEVQASSPPEQVDSR